MRKCCPAVLISLLAATMMPGRGVADSTAEPKKKVDAKKADQMKAKRRPTEFYSIFNFGYAADNFPKDPARFAKLVEKISREGHYNAILCTYSDVRAGLCKKYGIKMMVDLLTPDHHVYKNVQGAEALCRKLRDNPVILGYHLWSDHFGKMGAGRKRDINNVHQWDPTHLTYSGTWRTYGMRHLVGSDVFGYYHYHWKRKPHYNFGHLLQAWGLAKGNDVYFYRTVATNPGLAGLGNYNRSLYTVNTSIAFGLKGCLWFIGTRTMNAHTLEWTKFGGDINKVNKEIMPLKKEILKIGNPVAIYSTPITKTPNNRAMPDNKESMMPPGLGNHKFPTDFWIRPTGGEFVMGVFKDDEKRDAIFLANHNAYAEQDVTLKFSRAVRVSMFDRKAGKWRPMTVKDSAVGFKLGQAAGELLRFEE